ncbi:hypothetical protein ATO3_14015 [Marinibacterium profundimaris]|uniref:Bacterial sugar transferase domain-containing protein n=2 Tax=Marinibacterium profundimaris TaxID=1679460 RepID=A0A225NL38_9RHOB|nr:hypothetical protein ATO3_14015 [Marinibacterium profundimaris]
MMIIVFAPLMLFIAAAISLTSQGGVFFRHQRIGRDGVPFMCLKFRSMRPDAEQVLNSMLETNPAMREEWERDQKLSDDPRIIPFVGHLMRKSSLDELPQLFNVLAGEMSMVGPRPVTREELERYGPYKIHYLSLRPGLTGAWQIGGRSDSSYDERIRMDTWYCQNASLATDATILFRTAKYFMSGRLSGGR